MTTLVIEKASEQTFTEFPQRRVTVVVLTNRNDPEPYRLALAIAELVK